MTTEPREVRIPLAPGTPGEAADLLTEALSGHFSRIVCGEHMATLEIAFETTEGGLIGRLQGCCAAMGTEIEIHEACARELAAIHGLELCWEQAA